MSLFRQFFAVTVFIFLPTSVVRGAVQFVESPPLAQVVNVAVEGCTDVSPVSVPLITWGGDIATVHANGAQAETAKGSIFDRQGLKLRLFREDVFANQVKSYLSCKSPYLRGTFGMIHLAAEAANRDPRTKMVVIYQLTWSAGGDAMVVKGGIKGPRDLKGKTIALQAYGPHIDYLTKILRDAGLSVKDVKLRWTKDLTGTQQTPKTALNQADIDATMVIIPDALALTSGGTVGTGAEESVKGARILLTTKTANRIISDVYAVRSDYFASHRAEVEKFVRGLFQGEESLRALFKKKGTQDAEYKAMITGAAKLLLDSEQAVTDTEGMYSDAEFVGWNGNVKFFSDANYPRAFAPLNREIQEAFIGLGLTSKTAAIEQAKWSYQALKAGLSAAPLAEAQKFDPSKVAQVISKKTQEDRLGEGELFSFEVRFKPNQNNFSAAAFSDSFGKAINFAATYGGAVITIEGHSDPLSYLRKKKDGENQIVLSQIRQAAKNLSLTRAVAVRESLIQYAKEKGIKLDPSQFAVVGHGIDKPKNGMCGGDPCAPADERAWLNNMRVEFRMIQVEAEESVFKEL